MDVRLAVPSRNWRRKRAVGSQWLIRIALSVLAIADVGAQPPRSHADGRKISYYSSPVDHGTSAHVG